MTIIFTGLASRFIVMSVDSAVTNTFSDHQEYYTGRKSYHFPGVGVVATWGERAGNNIGPHLKQAEINGQFNTIDDLRTIVVDFLENIYQPHKSNLGNVGYNIVGFDTNGYPRFFQVLWAPLHREPEENEAREYQNYDLSPEPKALRLDYDGRFDVAHKMVNMLFEEINSGKDVRYNVLTPEGLIEFSDFVIRFASELTPEVSPPFYTYLIDPLNQIEIMCNHSFAPLSKSEIREKLALLKL